MKKDKFNKNKKSVDLENSIIELKLHLASLKEDNKKSEIKKRIKEINEILEDVPID